MKKLILSVLFILSVGYVYAEDLCQKTGWQNAQATRIESGDEHSLALDIMSHGKKQSIWANCGESCYGFTAAITGENYSASLNESVKVKLDRTAECDLKDTECMETGSAVCFIQDLKILSANKAGFDCNKATTRIEHTICNHKGLAGLDYQVNEQYRANLNELKAQGEKDQIKYAKADQRDWLLYQRNTCQSEKCLTREYEEKLGKRGKNYSMHQSEQLAPKHAYGKYSMQSQYAGGDVSIRKIANSASTAQLNLSFYFSNTHTCELEEKVKWRQNHWQFVSREFQGCEMRFYPRGEHLLTVDHNKTCFYYCGTGVGMGGYKLKKTP